MAWALLGLLILRRFLSERFSQPVVATSRLCIALGTNLYHYTAYDLGLSHCFTFFLFAAILYLTAEWHKTFLLKHILLLGLALGLVLITRPTDFIIVLLPLFWNVYSIRSLKEKLLLIKRYFARILAGIAVILLIAGIQMAYWRYTSGSLIYFSYQGEYFDFLHSRFVKGLFSYRKGWFIYTPVAFIGMLGFYGLWKKQKQLVPALAIFFIVFIYVVFSWKMWWYGCSFGCRPLIEGLAVLSLPFAAFTEDILRLHKRVYKAGYFTLIAFFIALNIFQSYQYSAAIISCDRETRASYWHVFGKTKVDLNELEQYQLHGKEYWDERGRIVRP